MTLHSLGALMIGFALGVFYCAVLANRRRTDELLRPSNRIIRAYYTGARDGRGAMLDELQKAGEN